jgi:hypothetical protein
MAENLVDLLAAAIEKVTLQVSTRHTQRYTVALFTTNDGIKSVSVGNALIALFTCHPRWTDALTYYQQINHSQ